MVFSDKTWERAALLTRFDGTPQADFTAGLAAAHFGRERVMASMGSNVPDDTPQPFSTHFLDTGLGALLRARV